MLEGLGKELYSAFYGGKKARGPAAEVGRRRELVVTKEGSEKGFFPLFAAAQEGKVEVARLLLACEGFLVNQVMNGNGLPPCSRGWTRAGAEGDVCPPGKVAGRNIGSSSQYFSSSEHCAQPKNTLIIPPSSLALSLSVGLGAHLLRHNTRASALEETAPLAHLLVYVGLLLLHKGKVLGPLVAPLLCRA